MRDTLKFTLSILAILALGFAATASADYSPMVLKNQFGEISKFQVVQSQGAAFTATVALTAAQVKALNGTPITLVAAQTGKTLKVASVEIAYDKKSAAFVLGTSTAKAKIRYNTSNIAIAEILEAGLIDQTSSKDAILYGPGAGGVGIKSQAIEIASDQSVGDMTGGTGGENSSVTITTLYNVLD